MKKTPFLIKHSILKNNVGFAIKDSYPVSKGHMLVVPKKKVKSILPYRLQVKIKILSS